MVFDKLVRGQDVGTDLTPPGDLLLFPFEPLELFFLLTAIILIESATEDFHSRSPIFMLRTLVLTGYHNPCRYMDNADRRISNIYMLSSMTAGTESVNPEVLLIYLDFDSLFDLWNHQDRSKGCVTAAIGIKRGNTHKAMNPGLSLEIPICIRTGHGNSGIFNPGLFPGLEVKDLGPKAPPLSPAELHAQKHLSPNLGLGPPCP